jgi:hypothetical protein
MNIYTFKTKNFTITVDSEPDYDMDLSFDETGEVREKIKSGEWEHFQVEIKILFRGEEIASDYLGGCIYANPREFRDHIGIRKYGANVGSYFSDMVRQSVKDARKHFENAPKLRAV